MDAQPAPQQRQFQGVHDLEGVERGMMQVRMSHAWDQTRLLHQSCNSATPQ